MIGKTLTCQEKKEKTWHAYLLVQQNPCENVAAFFYLILKFEAKKLRKISEH